MIKFPYTVILKNRRAAFTDKLNKRASNLLTILFVCFIVSFIAMMFTICMNRISEVQEVKLKIEEIMQINTFPYYYKHETKINKEEKKYYINGNILDSLRTFTSNLDIKIAAIEKIEKEVKEIEVRNSDLFKVFLALIGSIFAIVGFFGFKSINDARESALKIVTTEAIDKAKSEAAKVAHGTATEIASTIATTKTIETAKKETQDYLNNILEGEIKKIEQTTLSLTDERIVALEDKTNKLERPDIYEPEVRKTIEAFKKEILVDLEKIRREFNDYKEGEIRAAIKELQNKK